MTTAGRKDTGPNVFLSCRIDRKQSQPCNYEQHLQLRERYRMVLPPFCGMVD